MSEFDFDVVSDANPARLRPPPPPKPAPAPAVAAGEKKEE